MKYGKILTSPLVLILTLALLCGCSGKGTENNEVSTSGTEAVSSSPMYTSPPEIDDPRDIYAVDNGQILGTSSAVTEKNDDSPSNPSDPTSPADTSHTVKYTGFTVHGFTTPVKGEGAPSASVVPVYSKAGLFNYISENSYYDFDFGDRSLLDHANHYDDSFFYYNGIVIISLRDGAEGFLGAWDDGSALTLAIKEAVADSDATHVLIEMDSRFMSLWKSFLLYTE